MKRGKKLAAFAPPAFVAAAGLALSFPVWLHGWSASGDAIFHASWFTHFDAQLRDGELYPRWLAGMNAGLGSPALYYYPALPYYFASLLRPFVPAGAHNLGTLGAAAALAFTASGLTAYAWLKKIADARTAAVAAVVYLLLPYHSAVDLYTREAFAELWAFVWMPLVLKFARAVGRHPGAGSDPPDGDSRSSDETRDTGSADRTGDTGSIDGAGNSRSYGGTSNAGANDETRRGADGGSNGVSRLASLFGMYFRPSGRDSRPKGGDSRLSFAGLAVAYALLCASHPPATLIFSPFALAYAYLTARRARAALRAAAAMLVGAGLAAVYLLPALALQPAVSFADMLAFHYFERWLTFARADARDLYGLLLWGTLTTLALVACAALVRRRDDANDLTPAPQPVRAAGTSDSTGIGSTSEATERNEPPTSDTARRAHALTSDEALTSNEALTSDEAMADEVLISDEVIISDGALTSGGMPTADAGPRAELNFWIGAAAVSALLMTPASDAVWRALPALQRVQFPWRFNLVLSVAAAAAVARGLDSLRARPARANRRMLVFGGLILAAWLVFLAAAARRAYPPPRAGAPTLAESARAAFGRGRDAPEYRPRWSNVAGDEEIQRMLRRVCGETPPDVRACVHEGEGTAVVTRRGPRELELTVESATGLGLRVTQLYFPGWAARLDGRPHPLGPSPGDGLITLSVPPGSHRLRLRLEPTRPERAGTLVSAAALAALLLWLTLPRAPHRPRNPHEAPRQNKNGHPGRWP